MPVSEWSHRWKRNDDFPDCLHCNSSNTKEHHFTQVQGCSLTCHARNIENICRVNCTGITALERLSCALHSTRTAIWTAGQPEFVKDLQQEAEGEQDAVH